jgi:hypothetical protein
MGRPLMEDRSGLVVGAQLTAATGHAEREAATALVAAVPGRHWITVRAIAPSMPRASSPTCRPERDAARRAEPCGADARGRTPDRAPPWQYGKLAPTQTDRGGVAWDKTIASQRQTRFRGTARAGSAAANLIRLPRLLTAPS